MAKDEIKGFSVDKDGSVKLGFAAGVKVTVSPQNLDSLITAAERIGEPSRNDLVLLKTARNAYNRSCLSS